MKIYYSFNTSAGFLLAPMKVGIRLAMMLETIDPIMITGTTQPTKVPKSRGTVFNISVSYILTNPTIALPNAGETNIAVSIDKTPASKPIKKFSLKNIITISIRLAPILLSKPISLYLSKIVI